MVRTTVQSLGELTKNLNPGRGCIKSQKITTKLQRRQSLAIDIQLFAPWRLSGEKKKMPFGYNLVRGKAIKIHLFS